MNITQAIITDPKVNLMIVGGTTTNWLDVVFGYMPDVASAISWVLGVIVLIMLIRYHYVNEKVRQLEREEKEWNKQQRNSHATRSKEEQEGSQ